ncbi:SH2 domain-containing adapter protein D [Platysternon megacephalum]|uniref:SH2 domain-containing adapter protein D n=1 Tax=Platysternon megacephalum TaxID=55544 RepID=A0A4D9E557_9SAUR|nr:SH2 domain-containing adapter protein D [Platysternon megacephalum]
MAARKGAERTASRTDLNLAVTPSRGAIKPRLRTLRCCPSPPLCFHAHLPELARLGPGGGRTERGPPGAKCTPGSPPPPACVPAAGAAASPASWEPGPARASQVQGLRGGRQATYPADPAPRLRIRAPKRGVSKRGHFAALPCHHSTKDTKREFQFSGHK